MKTLVVLDKSRRVLESATLEVNLVRLNEPDVTIEETEQLVLIGDTLEKDGSLTPGTDPESERGREQIEIAKKQKQEQDKNQAIEKLATAAGLSKAEKEALKERTLKNENTEAVKNVASKKVI